MSGILTLQSAAHLNGRSGTLLEWNSLVSGGRWDGGKVGRADGERWHVRLDSIDDIDVPSVVVSVRPCSLRHSEGGVRKKKYTAGPGGPRMETEGMLLLNCHMTLPKRCVKPTNSSDAVRETNQLFRSGA